MINRKHLFLILCFGVFVSACTAPPLHTAKYEVSEAGWHKDTVYTSELNVTDTVSPYNFFLHFRHSAEYPYSNFFFFFETKLPNNNVIVDTIECPIARPSGKWLGSGLGDILDNKFIFNFNKRFPKGGLYTFNIKHGMRDTIVPAVLNVGFSIEKNQD